MLRRAGRLLLLFGAMVFICSGCNLAGTKKIEWKPAEPVNRPPFIHTVKYSGETLSIISEWYTGDVDNWEIIADANPSIDYNNMTPGSRIYIPANLLKTTKPLTEEYIAAYVQKNKPKVKEEKQKPAPKIETPPKKKDDFELIGPK